MKLHSPVASTTSSGRRRHARAIAVAERFEPAMGVHDAFRLAGRAGGEHDEGRSVSLAVERRRDRNRLCDRSAARVAPAHRCPRRGGGASRRKPGGGRIPARNFRTAETAVGSQSAMMCSSSLWPNCEFCSTGIAPIQMAARNAAANSAELVMRRRILSPACTPLRVRSAAKAKTMRWNSALLTGPSRCQEGRARCARGIAARSQRQFGEVHRATFNRHSPARDIAGVRLSRNARMPSRQSAVRVISITASSSAWRLPHSCCDPNSAAPAPWRGAPRGTARPRSLRRS